MRVAIVLFYEMWDADWDYYRPRVVAVCGSVAAGDAWVAAHRLDREFVDADGAVDPADYFEVEDRDVIDAV